MLRHETSLEIVGEARDGRRAVELVKDVKPDLLLMDVEMPGLNGIDAINQIRSEFPEARFIVLSTYTGDAKVVRALKAGAQAYILKRHVHKELLEAIRAVHAGKKRIAPEIAAELAEHAADDELTAREIDVLRLVAGGNGNKQIADQLSIGEATVRTHVGNILSKLAANDRTHAVTIALSRGIIELPSPSTPPKSG